MTVSAQELSRATRLIERLGILQVAELLEAIVVADGGVVLRSGLTDDESAIVLEVQEAASGATRAIGISRSRRFQVVGPLSVALSTPLSPAPPSASGVLITLIPLTQDLQSFALKLGLEVWSVARLANRLLRHPSLVDALAAETGIDEVTVVGTTELTRFQLVCFRGFSNLSLSINPRLTVLVGLNGAGKTSVLDALAMALSWFARRLRSANGNGLRPQEYDIQNGETEAAIHAQGSLAGHPTQWSVVATRRGQVRALTSDLSGLRVPVNRLQESLTANPSTPVPVLVYYPVDRSALSIPKRIRKPQQFTQLDAYVDSLVAGARDFRMFFDWFRQREDLENEQRRENPDVIDPQLDAVREAIAAVMPGYTRLRIRRNPQRMILNKGSVELVVNQLSHGEKTLLAMVGDLARRLAIANPAAERALEGHGIVLIDEVDLHLHAAWQRKVLPRLAATFPGCQLIVTTHSPLVLSEVPHQQIILLEDFQRVQRVPNTEGRDVAAILDEVMGVPRLPEWTRQRLATLGEHLNEGDLDAAQRTLAELEAKLGEDASELVRPRTTLSFLSE